MVVMILASREDVEALHALTVEAIGNRDRDELRALLEMAECMECEHNDCWATVHDASGALEMMLLRMPGGTLDF